MTGILKITVAIAGGLLIGGGSVQLLHAQSKPPAYVVAEVAVKDKEGFEQNFLKATQKDIADHGGKYLAGGYNKTVSLSGAEPQNRVVLRSLRTSTRSRNGAIRERWTWRTCRQQVRLFSSMPLRA